MDPTIEEIMSNHNKAESFISLFLFALDVLIYIVMVSLYNCSLKNMTSPKKNLYIFIMLDALSRLINIFTDAYSKDFIQEITFNLIASIQFYLALSIVGSIFSDRKIETFNENELKIKNKALFSFIFFCLFFSLKGIMISYQLFTFIQYMFILIFISIFYKYFNKKVELFVASIDKKCEENTTKALLYNLPFFISIYFSINYVLQLFALMISNKLYESYLSMTCTIFKEVGKYLVLLNLITIYNTYIKYIDDSDNSYVPQKQTKKVDVYKDEETVKL